MRMNGLSIAITALAVGLLTATTAAAEVTSVWTARNELTTAFPRHERMLTRLIVDGSIMAVEKIDAGVEVRRYSQAGDLLSDVFIEGRQEQFAMNAFGEVYFAVILARPDGTPDSYISKYDGTTGRPLWPGIVIREGQVSKLFVDSAGDLILVRSIVANLSVAKLSGSDGSLKWQVSVPGSGANAFPMRIGSYPDGDVILLVSDYVSTPEYRLRVVRMDGANGGIEWDVMPTIPGGVVLQSLYELDFAVDGAIVAAVNIKGSGASNDDALVLKFSPTGSELWRRAITDSSTSREAVRAVTFGADGSIALAASTSESNGDDFLTAVLEGDSGAVRWQDRFDATGVSPRLYDIPYRVLIDGSSAVFVMGQVNGYATGAASRVGGVKYEGRTGRRLWTTEPPVEYAGREALMLPSGDIVVHASLYFGTNVARIGSETGGLMWQRTSRSRYASGSDRRVELDPSGNAVVAGVSADGNIVVKKLDRVTGAPIWQSTFDYSATSDYPTVRDMKIDGAGDVYLCGTADPDINSGKYLVLKVSGSTGSFIWDYRHYGYASHQNYATSLAFDGMGAVFVTGIAHYYNGSYSGSRRIDTLKLWTSTGARHWLYSYVPASPYSSTGDQAVVRTTPWGDPLVAFSPWSGIAAQAGYDFGAICLANWAGTKVWERTYSAPGATSEEIVDAVADSNGDFVITGRENSFGQWNILTVKLANDGTRLWTSTYDGPDGLDDMPVALARTDLDELFLVGSTETITGSDTVTMRYSKVDGSVLWDRTLDGPGHGSDTGKAVEANTGQGVVIAGKSFHPMTGHDAFVAKYDFDGNVLWSMANADNGGRHDDALDMAVSFGSTSAYVAGGSFTAFFDDQLRVSTYENLPAARCSVAYSVFLKASRPGGSWSAVDPLPSGLALNASTGELSGVPTVHGQFAFRVAVSQGGDSQEVELNLAVVPAGADVQIITTANPVCGTATLSVPGTYSGYTWMPNLETTPSIEVAVGHRQPIGVELLDANGCPVRGSIDLFGVAAITAATIDFSGSTQTCAAGEAGLATAAVTGGGSIAVQWGYRTMSGGAITQIGGATKLTYRVRGADFPGDGTYYLVYQVMPACGALLTAGEVEVVIGPIQPPSNVVAEATGPNAITVTWTAPAAGADRYTIWRSNRECPGDTFTFIGQSVTTSYVDTTVAAGASYSYEVRNLNAAGTCSSGFSSCAGAIAWGSCTLRPTFSGITTVQSNGCTVMLGWLPATSNCANGRGIVYNVYRSTVSTFTPAPSNRISSCVSANTFEDRGAPLGTNYYIVRAEDSTGESSGACNRGNEDANFVVRSAAVSAPVIVGATIYSDNFEPGARPPNAGAMWQELFPGGVDNLSIVGCRSADAGTSSYKMGLVNVCSGAYAANLENWLTLGGDTAVAGTGLVLPAGGARLRFKHRYALETNYDGVSLHYKTDAMVSFAEVSETVSATAPYFVLGGYTASAWGRRVWGGNSSNFTDVSVNLDAVAGHRVWLRWRISSDSIVNWEGYYLDSVVVEEATTLSCSNVPSAVPAFGATTWPLSRKLQWLNPGINYDSTVIRRRDDGIFPVSQSDGVSAYSGAGGAGAADSIVLDITAAPAHFYAAFAVNGSGQASPRRVLGVAPLRDGTIKWSFSTGASATTPPGILSGRTYVVSNDRVYHGLNTGAAGGDWAASWVPASFNAPSQSRTLVLQIPVGGVTRTVTLVGTQDGYAHCIDGVTGAVIWTSPKLGDVVQGSPVAISTVYGSSFSLVLAGARNADGTGKVYGLSPDDGSIVWTFENSNAQGGDGLALGAVSDAVNFAYTDYAGKRRAWFASRRKVGGSSHTLWCVDFDATSVSRVWSADLGSIDGFPMISGSLLFVGTNAGKVYSIYAHTGELIWVDPISTNDGPVKVTVWPDAPNLRLYFSTTNYVWSADFNGGVRWRKAFVAPSTPNRRTGELLLGAGDGRLYQIRNLLVDDPALLDVRSVLVSDAAQPPYVGSPTFDRTNSLIYAGTDSGVVYAVQHPIP